MMQLIGFTEENGFFTMGDAVAKDQKKLLKIKERLERELPG